MERTGGELVVESLKAAGVDTVFGVHNIPIFDALARADGIRLVTPDFALLGAGFGMSSGQVRSAPEMGPVLKEALPRTGRHSSK